MSEEKAQEVEVAEPQEDSTQVSEVEVSEQNEPKKPVNESQERNWNSLRNNYEEEKRRIRELEKQVSEYTSLIKELATDKKQQPQSEEVEDDSDIPTLGQTKKTVRREAEKIAREIVQKTLDEREQVQAPQRLKSEHPDFDDIVTKENVDYLIKKEPELATILKDIKDQYRQGKAAYKFIKNLGIASNDSVQAMKQDASRNAAKPVSPNAIAGRNSVGDANMFSRGLTPELKKQLHQEMIDAIKKG